MRRNRLLAFGVAIATLCVFSACWGFGGTAQVQPDAPVEGKPFTFVQLCDPQLGQGGYEHDVEALKTALDQISQMKDPPAFVILCGDLINGDDGKVGDFTRMFDDYKKIAAGCKVKIYPLPGNHDMGKYPTERGLTQFRQQIGKDYYSFDHEGYTFILVNTIYWWSTVGGPVMDEERKTHDAWLVETVKKAKRGRLLVLGHHPLFLEDPKEERSPARFTVLSEKRDQILSLFEKHGVAAYLSGHQHSNTVNDYNGMQCVTSASTCVNGRDKDGKVSPLGYRLWTVEGRPPFRHEYVAIRNPPAPAKR